MNATITVSFFEKHKMLAVPAESVIFDKSKNWIMVFKDRMNIETRQVKVFSQVSDTAYISSGITEGEKVISKNAILIYDALND